MPLNYDTVAAFARRTMEQDVTKNETETRKTRTRPLLFATGLIEDIWYVSVATEGSKVPIFPIRVFVNAGRDHT